MLLLFGPVMGSHPSSVGGTTTSFAVLCRFLQANGVAHRVVPTNRFHVPGKLLVNAVYTLLRMLVEVPRAQRVMFNANPRGATLLAPPVYLYSRLWRRPIVFRMFGGDLIEVYEALPRPMRWLFERTSLRADLVLLQTRRLVDHFSALGARVRWLPNAREMPPIARAPGPYRHRLVFVGTICRTKGVDALISFWRAHGDAFRVRLYGPIGEPAYRWLQSEPIYGGVLPPAQIAPILADNDLLVLPTQHPGEGYPGVVIEANAVGLPAVATRWLSIPEIVHDGRTGWLVEPGDEASLFATLLAIDDAAYQPVAQAAMAHARGFTSEAVYGEMLSSFDALTTNRQDHG